MERTSQRKIPLYQIVNLMITLTHRNVPGKIFKWQERAKVSDTLMFVFFMFLKTYFLSSFVITLVTGVSDTFMF